MNTGSPISPAPVGTPTGLAVPVNGGNGSVSPIPAPRVVPLTCHGHHRPVVHLSFSEKLEGDQYYLISACKDNNPMLRDGITGDWIGTFLGHKGAVWQARLSRDTNLAATASADFSAKIWDTVSGECLQTMQHNHIVRSVAFSPQTGQNPTHVATGGQEKKLRIFDLKRGENSAFEIGTGAHTGTIKSIIWSEENVLLSASDDKKLRWWDFRSGDMIAKFDVNDIVSSCELGTPVSNREAAILNVTAGKTVYFFEAKSRRLVKSITTPHDVSSVALHQETRRVVCGGVGNDTWVRLYDYDTEEELAPCKGHHGPVWSVSFSPDGKLYASGSEDGTIKLWKYTSEPYGLWK